MYPADEGARRRPLVLGLILIVHLLLGYLILSPPDPSHGASHRAAFFGGSAGGTWLAPRAAAIPSRNSPDEGFQLSFDRAALVGPSTLPPPARPARGARKVAPPSHPS